MQKEGMEARLGFAIGLLLARSRLKYGALVYLRELGEHPENDIEVLTRHLQARAGRKDSFRILMIWQQHS